MRGRTANPGNVQLNNNGHFAQTAIVHNTKTTTCLGQSAELLQGDWRKRNNDKPVTVQHTIVDTTGCL